MNNQIQIDGMNGTIQQDGMVRFGSDNQLNVLFYMKSVLDPIQSREMGRPIHKGEVWVRTQQPGERDYGDRPLREIPNSPQRFPQQWAAYERSQAQAPEGTPVDILFPQNPEIALNLKAVGVHTVEQLAGLTAHGMETIGMGAMQWHNKAKQYLAAMNGAKGYNKLELENSKLKEQLEVNQNNIAMLKQQLDRLSAQVLQGIPQGMIPQGRMSVAAEIANEQNSGGTGGFPVIPLESDVPSFLPTPTVPVSPFTPKKGK